MLLLKEHEKEREGPLQLLQRVKATLGRVKPGVHHSKVTPVDFFTMPVTAGHTFLKYKSLLMMFSKMSVGHISSQRVMRAEAGEQDKKSYVIFTSIDVCLVQNYINKHKHK